MGYSLGVAKGMRYAISLMLLLFVAVYPTPSTPPNDLIEGNGLLEACTSRQPLQGAMCIGYIRGVIDGENMMGTALNKRPLVCLPQGVTLGQVEDVIVKYLKDNPAERNKPSAGLIGIAAASAWPCAQ
jgi:Rap1a immunity proteins